MSYEKYFEFECDHGTVYKGRLIIDGVGSGVDGTGAKLEKFTAKKISDMPNIKMKAKDVPAGKSIVAGKDAPELGIKKGQVLSLKQTAIYREKHPHVMCGVKED